MPMHARMEAPARVSLGETIRRILRDQNNGKGMSISELARRTGVSQSTLSRIISGETSSPGSFVLRRIAEELRLPASALLGRPSDVRAEISLADDVARIPIVRRPAHAGQDWTWEHTGERINVDRELTRGRDLFAVDVVGTCMSPDVQDRDIAIFDQWAQTPQDGEIVVVTADNQTLVRWARYGGRDLQLVDNNGVKLDADRIVLEGVVVEVRRRRPRRRDWHDLAE